MKHGKDKQPAGAVGAGVTDEITSPETPGALDDAFEIQSRNVMARFRWAVLGVATVTIGFVVPAAGAVLIPAGVGCLGLALKTPGVQSCARCSHQR